MNKISSDSKQHKFERIIRICLCICLLLTIAIYVYGQFFVTNPSLYASECEPYDAVWSYTDPSGVTRDYRTGEGFDISGVTDLKLTMKLPEDIGDGNCLFLNTGRDLDAYVDGELRNSYRLTDSVFGRNVKGMWVPITMRRSDSGKELTVVRPNYDYDDFYPGKVMIGNRLGFATMLIQENILILFLGFAIITSGTVITIICLIERIREKQVFPLWYLSLGVLGSAIWLILDNYTYPILFDNYFIDGISSYMVIMLIPFPFAAYVHCLLEGRYQKVFYLQCVMVIADFVILSLLQFLGIASFTSTMLFSNIIAAMIAVYLFGLMIYDTFVRKHGENKVITIGFSAFMVLCIAEIIHLNLPLHTNDGAFVAAGLLTLLIVAVTHEVNRLSEMRVETLEARNANRAKTTFLANMSHEIRTPINAILGMDELILRGSTDPGILEYAGNIKSAGTSLLEIISDVLDFSKIETGNMDIIDSEYDTALLIKSVITMFRIRTEEKGLDFIRNISPDIPSKLYGDEKRILEILINLLGNAVKYTPKGSIKLTADYRKTDEDHIVLQFFVTDTGIGIKETDRDKLFRQFERLDPGKTRSIEGTGLGLAITANLIKLMDGTIECDSTYGKGSEFRVSIPQTVMDPAPMGDIEKADPPVSETSAKDAPERLDGINILVVDDSIMNLKVASGLLGVLKANVTTCKSGARMLELITGSKYDIILLDHMMPGLDGIEALERAKTLEGNLNTDTPYIALTANAIAGAREMYLEKGFSDYLSKPMKLEELSKVIRSNLASPSSRQS